MPKADSARLRLLDLQLSEAMAKLGDLLDRGEIHPHIDRTFPFTAAGAAASHTYLHERKNFGKLVLVKEGVAPTR